MIGGIAIWPGGNKLPHLVWSQPNFRDGKDEECR